MTFTYDNVYVNNYSTVGGPYEKDGPLGKSLDKVYTNLYAGEKTWEQAEVKMLSDSIDVLLNKSKKESKNIDMLISGDLLNQVTASSYAALKFNIPFFGIYGACSTSVEGIIMMSSLIDGKKIKNGIVSVSSHNMSSEKQFRNPTEYGAPKPKTATFTSTGGASILLSSQKGKIKVESSTIGKVVDMDQTDPFNMGGVMAAAAGDTIYRHLKDMKRSVNDYDLILTGDLGRYGREILIDYMHQEYGIDLGKNYDDCGTMLYDLKKQEEVLAGASGPLCIAMVSYADILPRIESGSLKRVLLVATGALFSPTFVYQHKPIYSISHAVCLEGVK